MFQQVEQCFLGFFFRTVRICTYIVLTEVWMVLFYSIIQDGHHHPFTCVTQLPSSFGIQVMVVGVVLRMEKNNY